MPVPVKEDVQGILEPYHRRIRSVVERAWAEWRAVADFRSESSFSPVLYPRTVANYVFDAIARIAIAEFAGETSVHIRIEAQTVKFFFKSGVLARFKKGDDQKLGRNIQTQTVMAFTDADGCFPGMPPETAKIEVIWLPNDLHTRLENVLVVARDNDRLLWEYEIEPLAEEAGMLIPFPPPLTDPDGMDNEGLVNPKIAKNIKNADEE
jgi:hypothetical protein